MKFYFLLAGGLLCGAELFAMYPKEPSRTRWVLCGVTAAVNCVGGALLCATCQCPHTCCGCCACAFGALALAQTAQERDRLNVAEKLLVVRQPQK